MCKLSYISIQHLKICSKYWKAALLLMIPSLMKRLVHMYDLLDM